MISALQGQFKYPILWIYGLTDKAMNLALCTRERSALSGKRAVITRHHDDYGCRHKPITIFACFLTLIFCNINSNLVHKICT